MCRWCVKGASSLEKPAFSPYLFILTNGGNIVYNCNIIERWSQRCLFFDRVIIKLKEELLFMQFKNIALSLAALLVVSSAALVGCKPAETPETAPATEPPAAEAPATEAPAAGEAPAAEAPVAGEAKEGAATEAPAAGGEAKEGEHAEGGHGGH
jgi:hypothetical protein